MNMTVWGDPATVARMSEAFYRGQGLGQMANGFNATAPEALTNGLGSLISGLTAVLREKGLPVSEEMVRSVVEEAKEKATTGDKTAS